MSFLFENPENLRLLQKLLTPQDQQNRNADDDSDTDEETSPLLRNNITPGSIGAAPQVPQEVKKKSTTARHPKESQLERTPKTVEEWQAMQEKEDGEILETRKCPEYTMTYRQAVGTEDVYLQMGNRSSGSASCEDLLLEILLPDDTTPADKMDLSITESEVDLATQIYRLKLPLVHKVNVDRCRAKYDAERGKLCLTLRLTRELDFVNF